MFVIFNQGLQLLLRTSVDQVMDGEWTIVTLTHFRANISHLTHLSNC